MSEVRIVEVGPRDGLQNEATPIPTDVKERFVRRLVEAGMKEIEVTSFVSPKWVPQLADADELWSRLPPGPTFWSLVPNLRGAERALAAGADHLAAITAASDEFTRRNMNMGLDDSLNTVGAIVALGLRVRVYVSTAFECPYSGRVAPDVVADLLVRLSELGVVEFSLGDTIGAASPKDVRELVRAIQNHVRLNQVAFHFHDTRGTAIANVAEAMELGIRAFDSSAGGLGGCPYAPGAGGNLATEDLLYFLGREGIAMPMSLAKVADASTEVLGVLGRPPESKAQRWSLAAGRTCPK